MLSLFLLLGSGSGAHSSALHCCMPCLFKAGRPPLACFVHAVQVFGWQAAVVYVVAWNLLWTGVGSVLGD